MRRRATFRVRHSRRDRGRLAMEGKVIADKRGNMNQPIEWKHQFGWKKTASTL